MAQSAIAPKEYDGLLDRLEQDMKKAKVLGLHRTAEKLHGALNEARSERFEAQPEEITLDMRIGPDTKQPGF